MKTRTALVCDDHPIFRSGVVYCLNEIKGIKVIAEASDVESAIGKLQIYEPDILTCDLSLPGQSGFELLKWCSENRPHLHCVVLTMHNEVTFVQRARALGAAAFLAKEDAETDLVHAINTERNSFYTSDSIGRTPAKSTVTVSEQDQDLLSNVSTAEMRVLVQLAKSKTSREIAQVLSISPRTVEAHRSSLAEKLNARGPNKLLEFAIRHAHLFEREA